MLMNIVVTGAGGFLGSYVLDIAGSTPAIAVSALRLGPSRLPLSLPIREIQPSESISVDSLARLLKNQPTHILHIGALSAPDACERAPEVAFKANAELTQILTDYASSVGAHITFISTDLVFDGGKAPLGGLRESDSPSPHSQYARSKLAGEAAVLRYERGCVLRLSLIYGHAPSSAKGVLGWMEKAFENHETLPLFHDEYRTPIHVADATHAIMEAATHSLTGVWHCGGPERISRVEFGQRIAEALGYDPKVIRAVSRSEVLLTPTRPEDVALNSSRLMEEISFSPKDVKSALAAYTEWR